MSSGKSLLIYEPRTEGHHLGWLRFITEDLLSANCRICLAVDLRPEAKGKLEDHLGDLLKEVKVDSAYDSGGRRHLDGKARSVAYCLRQSGSDRVFLAAFDEIASWCWRRSTLGFYPPGELRGRMGGIYHRPRMFIAPQWSPNGFFKRTGFSRLVKAGWLAQLLFVDEFLQRDLQAGYPGAPIFFLPDPCPKGYDMDGAQARRELGVPPDKRVFLFYGIDSRRKGLHLAVEAMLGMPKDALAYLLCVGQQKPDAKTEQGLQHLAEQGRARRINRYVSLFEEKLSFAACDAVLLPYLNHFGTSGVLSRAMASGKMVIVSDEQLLGRLTREQSLGLLFASGDVARLRESICTAASASLEQMAAWRSAAKHYAERYSREAYRAALLTSLGLAAAP